MLLNTLHMQKKKKAERSKRQKEEEKAVSQGLEPPPRKQQKVRNFSTSLVYSGAYVHASTRCKPH